MNTFETFDLIAPIQRALADMQFTAPTPIQAKAIPPAIEGRDILGCAQTGTGKTAAFALPILNSLGEQTPKPAARQPLALILAPTRELAIQIDENFASFGKQLRVRRALVYGGVSQLHQVRALNRGAHIVIATPGRLIDLMGQGHIDLRKLEVFVLDEVDRMLDMGFLPDLKRIVDKLPSERQSLFFSATLPPKIRELANQLLIDPVSVNVTPKSPSVTRIEQQVIFAPSSGKHDALHQLVNSHGADRVLVFTKTKHRANRLVEKLLRGGTKAAAIHGNKSQNARQQALSAFQRGNVDVLVATDVAARGIDVNGITHVVNYDLPGDPESYMHRIGRTGRAGGAGIAVSLCSEQEHSELRAIEQFIGKSLEHVGGDAPRTRPVRSAQTRPGKTHSHRDAKPDHTPAPKPKRRRRFRSGGKQVNRN